MNKSITYREFIRCSIPASESSGVILRIEIFVGTFSIVVSVLVTVVVSDIVVSISVSVRITIIDITIVVITVSVGAPRQRA